jgi:4-amino-4-deoxy-L-arabinose transferase-like glycosyltransferase
VRTFGRTILAVRITSVFAGALAVVATYHYAKIAFNRRTAVYAAVFLTGFHLHNHFSRIGLNNIWDSLFIALISGAFWSAWTNHKKSPGRSRRSFIVAGMLLGFSQYFYTGSRILFPMLGLLFFIAWLRDREDFQSHIPGIILMLAGTLIVLLPLGMYYGKHPSDFFASMQRVTIFGDWLSSQVDSPGLSAAAILANRIKDAFLVFTHNNLRGWYSPGQPMLLPAPAILFLLGTALILLRGFDLQAAWILFWLLGTIAIKTLSVAPFAQRLVISTPAVAVIIGFALDQIAGWFKSIWPNLRRPIAVVITLILVVACVGDIYFYFFKYTPSKTFSDLNTEVAFEVIHLLQQKPPGTHVYFSGQPRMGYFTHASVQYLCPHTSGEDIPTPLSQEASIPIYDSTVFIFLPDNIEDLQTVQKQHPGGTVDETIGHDGRVLFTAYAVTKP